MMQADDTQRVLHRKAAAYLRADLLRAVHNYNLITRSGPIGCATGNMMAREVLIEVYGLPVYEAALEWL